MFDEYVIQGTVRHQYAMILSLLLSLRQACDHPFLLLARARGILKRQDEEGMEQALTQDMITKIYEAAFCGREAVEAYARSFIQELEEDQNISQRVCPICCDPIGMHPVFTKCFHVFCERCIDTMAKHNGVASMHDCHIVSYRMSNMSSSEFSARLGSHRLSHVRIYESRIRCRKDVAFEHKNRFYFEYTEFYLERVSKGSRECFYPVRKHLDFQSMDGDASGYWGIDALCFPCRLP